MVKMKLILRFPTGTQISCHSIYEGNLCGLPGLPPSLTSFFIIAAHIIKR